MEGRFIITLHKDSSVLYAEKIISDCSSLFGFQYSPKRIAKPIVGQYQNPEFKSYVIEITFEHRNGNSTLMRGIAAFLESQSLYLMCIFQKKPYKIDL